MVSTLNEELLGCGFRPIALPDATLYYKADFLDATQADRLLQSLAETLQWQQDAIRMFGKTVAIPRLQAWYGDPQAHYRYSGLDLQPLPWTHELSALRTLISETTGLDFNAVLANRYRDGRDSVGWHQDNETELGPAPVIASLTLGAERRFCLRHVKRKIKHQLPLAHGSLLVMAGKTQQHWLHALPKSTSNTNLRINLSFRKIIGRTAT